LLKTFWGWRDHQLPDGTVIWTCPQGQTYTTYPGSRLLFPSLCRPTAPVTARETPTNGSARGLAMPRRATTRAQNRTHAINEERRINEAALYAEAEEEARQQRAQREDPGSDCAESYFPSWPRPPSPHDDPAPF
jgi:hypothetical protein